MAAGAGHGFKLITQQMAGVLLRGGNRTGGEALGERESFGFLAFGGAFLDVVFAFAVSHRAGNRHASRPEAKGYY